jgi:type I restriction enzyme S subunit
MKGREIDGPCDRVTKAALYQNSIVLIEPPALLIVVRGMILARTFLAAVTTALVTVNQDLKAFLPKPELNANYLVPLLTGIQHVAIVLAERQITLLYNYRTRLLPDVVSRKFDVCQAVARLPEEAGVEPEILDMSTENLLDEALKTILWRRYDNRPAC